MISTFNKLLDPLRRRVRLMITRAVLSTISDGEGIQVVQIKTLATRTADGAERFQNYAFTSVPLPGAEGILAAVMGNFDHGIVIAMDDRRYRVKDLQPGEAAMYTHKDKEAHKHRIIFKNDGSIEVLAKNITVKATETTRIEGDSVVIHAASMFKFDVNGQGQKWDGLGVETWQDDDVAKPHHNHVPPEIP